MTKIAIVRSLLSFTVVVLMIALVADQAGAQVVDTKGDKELTQLIQKIDKGAAERDGGHVAAKIVDEWKWTKFKLDANGAPRRLTARDIQDLRAKKLGFGEIATLLALTAAQPNSPYSASAKSVNWTLTRRQAGEGWGKLGRDLGYQSLGPVVESVKGIDRDLTKVAMERAEKPNKTGSMDKQTKSEKPGR
jgi:hypothetical protein